MLELCSSELAFHQLFGTPTTGRSRHQSFINSSLAVTLLSRRAVDKVDAAFFDAAGDQLKVVSNYAVGFDNIDVAEAIRRSILIGHTPNAVTEPTADIAWLLLLAAARRAREGLELVTSGEWDGVGPNELLGNRIVGKTLFIVGAGRIGHATARRSIGWDMDVLYHARSHHPEFEAPPNWCKASESR